MEEGYDIASTWHGIQLDEWEKARAAFPAEKEDRKKRLELWEAIDDDIPPSLTLPALEHGLKLNLGIGDIVIPIGALDLESAIHRAYVYAREISPQGTVDQLDFAEFRLLLVYLNLLLGILQILSNAGVRGDVIRLEEVEAVAPQLESIVGPDVTGLTEESWQVLKGDRASMPFSDFTDWAVRLKLTGHLLLDREDKGRSWTDGSPRQTVDGAAEAFRTGAHVHRKHHPKLHDRNQPEGAVLECLTATDVDIELLRQILRERRPEVNFKDASFAWTPLHFAANHGRVDLIKVLIEKKADTNIACGGGNIPLHIASRCGNIDVIKFLCAKTKKDSAAVKVENMQGMTALTCASMNGHIEAAQMLFTSKANVDDADAAGLTPAMWAVRHGHGDMLNLLLGEGFNLNAEDVTGATVMDHAVEHFEMQTNLMSQSRLNERLLDAMKRHDSADVNEALTLKANVNAKDDVGFTSLSWAMLNNATDLVKLLAQRNANPNNSDFSALDLGDDRVALEAALDWGLNTGKRLIRAAKMERWDEVEVELANGANVNQQEEGTLLTCIMCATAYCNVEQVLLLAGKKANLNQRDVVGWSTSHFAAYSGNYETVSLLLDLKADFLLKTYEQQSMLHLAARADDGAMVQVLLAAKAKHNQKDAEHDVPLQVAAKWGSSEAFVSLLKYEADATVRDSASNTLIMLACLRGHSSVVEALLISMPELPQIQDPAGMTSENKDDGRYKLIKDARRRREQVVTAKSAQPNVTTLLAEQDDLGRYLLHIAVICGWEHICSTIVRAKAKIDSCDHHGDSAVMLAAAAGNQPIVELLLSHGADVGLVNKDEKTAVDLAETRGIRRSLQKYVIEGRIPAREVKANGSEEVPLEDRTIYRVRVEGFPRFLMPDLLEHQVQVMLRRLGALQPSRAHLVLDPISGRPLGYAHVDFWSQEEADFMASHRTFQLPGEDAGSTTLRFISEGPRANCIPPHD